MEFSSLLKMFDSMDTFFIACDFKGQIKMANNLFLYTFENTELDMTNISYIDLELYHMLNSNAKKKIEVKLSGKTYIAEKFATYEYCLFLVRKRDDTQTNKIYEKAVNSINERIVASDKYGNVLLFNKASENFEKIGKEFVLGRKITEIYDLTEETSLLMNVIKSGKPLLNVHQISTNSKGKRIDDMVDTWPIYDSDELFGAVSIMTDYTKIAELSRQIIDLQNKLINPDNTEKGKSPLAAEYTFNNIVCYSNNMQRVISIAKRAAKSTSPILIYGETGTGKEMFAQSIHNDSDRSHRPFIAINCAAIPDNLLEGILFGTVKGAFSDAIDRPGLFEQADGGTILLDELNSMSLNLQSKLLRVIQENKVRRVGGSNEIAIKIPLITAMNENPVQAVGENRIRQDLFYRIGVILLEIPPLRARKEDLALLSQLFINKLNISLGKNINKLSSPVLEIFHNYDWPGNVRELQHTLEYAMNICDYNDRLIELHNLPNYVMTKAKKDDYQSHPLTLEERLNIEEIKILEKELMENDWKIAKTAKKLGLKRQSLQYRIKKYSLKKDY